MLIDEHVLHALGHAADDADDETALPLQAVGVQLVQARKDLLLGIVAHRARVDHDRVGLVERLAGLIARHLHHGGHDLAVGHIHLAAISLEQQPLGHVTLPVISQFYCHVLLFFLIQDHKGTIFFLTTPPISVTIQPIGPHALSRKAAKLSDNQDNL